VLISGTRVLSPLGTFLQVEGERSQRILLNGNDFGLASATVSVGEKASPGAVSTDSEKDASH